MRNDGLLISIDVEHSAAYLFGLYFTLIRVRFDLMRQHHEYMKACFGYERIYLVRISIGPS